ncbi:MAG: glutathione S-transferase family protein, partial [Roseovarius sp.]|nr:glutathione S-transferase family protein [Roseovarius sp.]
MAICEYLEEKYPDPPLLPATPEGRYEARRLVSWFDDKFNHEVTGKLVHERVNKRIMKLGTPDSASIMAGTKAIKFHLGYMIWLLERRRWIAGDVMTMADFAAAAHLSCLDYISDVEWKRAKIVKEWYVKIKSRPAFRSILADHIPGIQPSEHYSDLDF